MEASTRRCPGGEQVWRYSSVTLWRGVCLTHQRRPKHEREGTPSLNTEVRRCLRSARRPAHPGHAFRGCGSICPRSLPVRWQGALCQVSQRGHREPCLSQLRLPATIVPRVWRYRRYRKCSRHVYGSHQRRQDPVHPRPNYLGLHQTKRAVEDCERPLLCNTQGSLRIEPGHIDAWRCTMTINNPLADNSPDHEDQSLVLRARSGDRQALEDLVQRHQTWIYTIAIRMLHHPQDAEDVTQEILIKVLTRLSSFEGRSSFRTWLYRIVVNHVLNMKRGQVEAPTESSDFAAYGAALDATPDLELADLKVTSAEADLLVTEEMLSCTSGMLLCLDRQQRLTFILGAIFEVSDTVGAEVLEITPDNFRQRLARARRDLRNFMSDKCGLVNQAHPCRCAKKTRAFIQAGYVDPENLLFVRERIGEVREAAPKVHEALSTLDEKCAEIFRGHPFYKAPDLAPMLRRLVARTHITT